MGRELRIHVGGNKGGQVRNRRESCVQISTNRVEQQERERQREREREK
jgi:hypothetical protein